VKKILVVGATGPQAQPVAEKLVEAGYKVRALVRDPARAKDLADKGMEVFEGDLNDAASVSAAMRGQDGVFLLVSFISGQLAQARNVIDAAVEAKARKLVWNSTGPILNFRTGNPSADLRLDILQALEASSVPFVALQPTTYMENLLIPAIAREVAEKNVLAYPMPDTVTCQWISHLDAASFAVAAFDDGSRDNLSIEICGPEKLSGPQIAERFSRALGRTITFRPMPPEEFAGLISFGGNEDAVIGHYKAVFDDPTRMGTNVDYGHAVARLPIVPTSMEAFAQRYRALFTQR